MESGPRADRKSTWRRSLFGPQLFSHRLSSNHVKKSSRTENHLVDHPWQKEKNTRRSLRPELRVGLSQRRKGIRKGGGK